MLPPAVVQVLREYRESVHSRWMFPSPVLEDLPLNPGSVYDRLQLILEHASCKQVRFHDLRHTFATMAISSGVDVKTLSSMLGHYSAGFTLDTYDAHHQRYAARRGGEDRRLHGIRHGNTYSGTSRPAGEKPVQGDTVREGVTVKAGSGWTDMGQ